MEYITDILNIIDQNSSILKIIERNISVDIVDKVYQVKIIQEINLESFIVPIITMMLVTAAYFSSKNQLKEETKKFIFKIDQEILSKNRQQWINEFRNEISNFLSIMKTIDNLNLLKENNEKVIRKIIEESNNLFTSKSKINLYLEPNDIKSKKLLEVLEVIISKLIENNISSEDYTEVISLTQSILSVASSWNHIDN